MNKLLVIRGKKGERGLSLLEYAAGAAVIASVVFAAMGVFGNGVSGFFGGLTTWLNARATQAASN